MSWSWPKTDRLGLARFASGATADSFTLQINRSDLSPDATGRRTLIEAIYFAVQEKNIRYALEKYNSADAVQLVRSPSEILAQREGTCLDLAILFCGVCIGFELLPLLVLIDGHALTAVSLNHDLRTKDSPDRRERRFFENAIMTDGNALAQLVASGGYIAVECTGFAQTQTLPKTLPEGNGRDFRGFLPFQRSLTAGAEQLAREDRPFLFALDVAAAHDAGFDPITQTTKPQDEHRRRIEVGKDFEGEDMEIGEVVGSKGAGSNADVNVLSGAKLKRVKIDSIVGESSGDGKNDADK